MTDNAGGELLSRMERQFRMMALRSLHVREVPKSWATSPWPRPINQDGYPSGCRKTRGRDEVLLVEYEGRSMRWIDLAIEVASGVSLREEWWAEPVHCGDPLCENPHHWAVMFDEASDSSRLPPPSKIGKGFQPQSSQAS